MRSFVQGSIFISLALLGALGSADDGSSFVKPLVWYSFDGDLNDRTPGGSTLTPDRKHFLHFGFDPGRDGKNSGAVHGLGIAPFPPARLLSLPQWTIVVTVFAAEPRNITGGQDTSMVFVEASLEKREDRTENHAIDPEAFLVPRNSISVTTCGKDEPPSCGVAAVWLSMPPPDSLDSRGLRLTAPMSSGAWHEITVIYDWPGRQLAIKVDGVGNTAPLTAPIEPCHGNSLGPCVLEIGGPTEVYDNIEFGATDDFKFFARAPWPTNAVTSAKGGLGKALHP
ncbi:MAG: hypothetical protein ABI183_12050 [Polyangiaceae bacterium]